MLCLTRKTDYALYALGFMAERGDAILSAREIAGSFDLPLALLTNILKRLQSQGILRSVRGSNGGYRIGVDLQQVSLHELIRVIEGKVEPGCDHERETGNRRSAPIQALHSKLMRFLREVSLADLVMPGRRIDVPIERLTRTAKPVSRSRELVSVEV